jgi:hypothetical protein
MLMVQAWWGDDQKVVRAVKIVRPELRGCIGSNWQCLCGLSTVRIRRESFMVADTCEQGSLPSRGRATRFAIVAGKVPRR